MTSLACLWRCVSSLRGRENPQKWHHSFSSRFRSCNLQRAVNRICKRIDPSFETHGHLCCCDISFQTILSENLKQVGRPQLNEVTVMGNSASGSNAVCVRLDREAYPSGSSVSGNVYVNLQAPSTPFAALYIKVRIQVDSGIPSYVGIFQTSTF